MDCVLRVIWHRLMISIPLLFAVTLLTFVLNSLAPGDIARTLLGADGTEQQYQELRTQLGLDRPVLVRYGLWLWSALQGNLGYSFFNGESVLALVNGRIGVTLSIMAGVLVVVVTLGLLLGTLSAVWGGWAGRFIDTLSIVGLIFPSFFMALLMISVFAVWLRWLPATGYTMFTQNRWQWAMGLVLPILSVALYSITSVAKQTRDSMNDVLRRDFIRSLRASGVPERKVIFKHALRNASLPVVTVLGLVMIGAISGTVFVERVFVLPGLGSLAVEAATRSDVALLQGATLYFALLTIAINLIIDLSYGWLDPRVRVS